MVSTGTFKVNIRFFTQMPINIIENIFSRVPPQGDRGGLKYLWAKVGPGWGAGPGYL
jgi:hypothetical protein